jgi:hypothetical protein
MLAEALRGQRATTMPAHFATAAHVDDAACEMRYGGAYDSAATSAK